MARKTKTVILKVVLRDMEAAGEDRGLGKGVIQKMQVEIDVDPTIGALQMINLQDKLAHELLRFDWSN